MRNNALYRVLLVVLALALLPLPLLPAHAQDGNIDRAALLHDSRDDLYRVPVGAVPIESRVTLRFRTAANDVDAVAANVYNWATDSQDLVEFEVANTTPDGYDIWEAALDVGRKPTIYWYRFLVRKGGQTIYYEDDTRPEDGLGPLHPAREGGPGQVYDTSPNLSYQITVYDSEFYTPEWMRNAVIYQIFPDRFRNGNPTNDPADDSDVFYGNLPLYFHETWNEPMLDGRVDTTPGGVPYYNSDFYGGDLAGVIDKLDYLEDLGVTALYLNPVFEARSNHRYDTADFKTVDPILGDIDTFRTLVEEAEARGMVIILDAVFNHLSSDSYFFDRYHRFDTDGACESLDSPWREWFFFTRPRGNQPDACVDDGNGNTYYVSWAGYDSIPKINNDLLEPRQYFFLDEDSVARIWGKEGIGGWRLDVAGDIDAGGTGTLYWEPFRAIVREINAETVIIGEEWDDATRWLLGKEWDSVMNYRLRTGILGFARDEMYMDNDANGDRIIYALAPSAVDGLIRAIEEDYPPMAYHAMMNLLGSHDTSRVFYVLDNDLRAQQLAALLQFTLPGAPMVYYGDEIAIDAPSVPDSGGNIQDDPYNRAPYPWTDTSGDHYPPPNPFMLAYYRQIADLRSANPALREGDMITLLTDDDTGVYAFLRVDAAAGNAALVVLNNGDAAQEVDLSLAGLVPDRLTLEPLFAADAVTTGAGAVTVRVDATRGNVWTVTAGAPFIAPDVPADLAAAGQNNAVRLSWEPVDVSAGYKVYRSPVAVGGFEPVSDVITDASYTDDSVINGFRYYYAVAAVGTDGLTGDLSSSVMAIPSAAIDATFYIGDEPDAPAQDYEPITLPLVIGATVELEAGVRIAGVTEADGATPGIRAEAALVTDTDDLAGADWLPMGYVYDLNGADVYAYTFEPQAPGEYTMLARFSTNAGESWNVATYQDGTYPMLIVEASDDTTAPEPPAAVTITRATLSGVIVEWDASPADDIYAYRITRTGADGSTEQIGEVLAEDANRFVDKAVAEGAEYTYGVAAVDTSLNEADPVTADPVEVEQGMVPVTFNVTVPDYTPPEDQVFIAGALGPDYPHWDPAGLEMTKVDDTRWTITLELAEGANIEYKFVRNGAWDYVEKGAECEEIANRKLNVVFPEDANELVVDHVVEKWRDLDNCDAG
jgi:glycosidase